MSTQGSLIQSPSLLAAPAARRVFVRAAFAAVVLASAFATVRAADAPALLDDFSDAVNNNYGVARLLVDDRALGSQSRATLACADGVLTVKGELAPGRGVPAFISLPLVLAPDGKPRDLTGYAGVKLRVKIASGNLTVQVSTTEITNFDYHTSAPVERKPGEFVEVRVPFATMKRAWSEPVPLNLKTVTSINLVMFSVAPATFAYEVDEIGFY